MEQVKNKFHEIFWNELRKLSYNPNAGKNDILGEWRFSHKMVVDDFSEECLCTHEICQIFFYKNVLNGTLINVGSNCIDYWKMQVPLCDCGGKLSRARILKDKTNCPSCEKVATKLELFEQRKKQMEERDKQLALQKQSMTGPSEYQTKYKLEEKLGSGGFGSVYKVQKNENL
jgi:hypothetical protein